MSSVAATRMAPKPAPSPSPAAAQALLPDWIFAKMLSIERSRAERAGRRFVLMLLESKSAARLPAPERIQQALAQCVRATDLTGWYRDHSAIGVLYTEVEAAGSTIVDILADKVRRALVAALGHTQASDIELSFHVFPDDFGDGESTRRSFSAIYPELHREADRRRPALVVKRVIDILGSLILMLLLSPVLLAIAFIVKCTSKGPVLFRQKRLGQFGEAFTFLKFRSMYVQNDHSIHEAYIKRLISKQTDSDQHGSTQAVFKIKNDPRITKVGAFLRRTSLDELPQLFHVLSGKMSLVGPRPPLPYEFESYDVWHRRRLFVKPGITGYWQIEGRSRVNFDEMVRMDIRYARAWSLWLDLKILLRTPRAVLSGDGAY